MPYDPLDLTPNDTTDGTWALAWTRFLLRDTSATPAFADAELNAVLESTAFEHETVTHYRPHVAAATLIESDPDRATSESILGVSTTTRSPTAIASAIRKSGRWVDDRIEAATGGVRPPSGRELTPVW